jgi:hypothetical protein
MPVKRIPKYFFFKSLRESRKIREAIKCLESDIQMLHEDELDLEEMSEFEKSFFSTEDCSPATQEDVRWELIEEHSSYQNYLVKNIHKLRNYIHPLRIARYFALVETFDKEIHRLDPDYPVLRSF